MFEFYGEIGKLQKKWLTGFSQRVEMQIIFFNATISSACVFSSWLKQHEQFVL